MKHTYIFFAVDDNSQPTLLFQFVIYLWHELHYRLDTKGQTSPLSICPLNFTSIVILLEKRTLIYAIFGSIFSKHITFICAFILHTQNSSNIGSLLTNNHKFRLGVKRFYSIQFSNIPLLSSLTLYYTILQNDNITIS